MKAAEGRTVRDEVGRLLPAEGADLDLDNPFWHRRQKWGDIVEVPADPKPAKKAN